MFFLRVERRINSYLNSWPTCHLTAFAPPAGLPPCSSTSRPSHPGISLIKDRTSLPQQHHNSACPSAAAPVLPPKDLFVIRSRIIPSYSLRRANLNEFHVFPALSHADHLRAFSAQQLGRKQVNILKIHEINVFTFENTCLYVLHRANEYQCFVFFTQIHEG